MIINQFIFIIHLIHSPFMSVVIQTSPMAEQMGCFVEPEPQFRLFQIEML
jgi:hypothetical protein